MLVCLWLLCNGCAMSVRAHSGVVFDEHVTGIEAGLDLGVGLATKRSATVMTAGVAAGQAPHVGLAVGLDYTRIDADSDSRFACRVGFGGIAVAAGSPSPVASVHVAALRVLSDHHTSGSEKFNDSTRKIMALGVEGGLLIDGYDTAGGPTHTTSIGGSVQLTAELLALTLF